MFHFYTQFSTGQQSMPSFPTHHQCPATVLSTCGLFISFEPRSCPMRTSRCFTNYVKSLTSRPLQSGWRTRHDFRWPCSYPHSHPYTYPEVTTENMTDRVCKLVGAQASVSPLDLSEALKTQVGHQLKKIPYQLGIHLRTTTGAAPTARRQEVSSAQH